MRIRHIALALLVGSELVASPALSQGGPAALANPAPAISAGEPAAITNPAPAGRFGFFGGQQLEISSGTEDDELTFRAALPTGPGIPSRFALAVSTPLRGDDDAMPASLNALANGSRITLSWGYFDVPLPRFPADPVADSIEDEAERRCLANSQTPETCGTDSTTVARHWPERYFDYRRRSIGDATDLGVDLSVGINDFEWVDPVTLTPQKDRHTDWSVAGHATRYLAGSMTALTGSISYQRAYEAVEEQQICPPNTPNPPTGCITGRGAAPTRNENFLLSVGLRHRLVMGGRLMPLAVAPALTYDVIDDIWGVDVPIYFVPDQNGRLNGGLRLSYRSDREDEFAIGFFVGTTFNILQ